MSKAKRVLLFAYDLGYRCDANGNVTSPTGNILQLYGDGRGYLCFSVRMTTDIHYKPISRAVPVHRLQAYQKFGDRIFDKNIQVRHLNGVSVDNSWDNLDIGSVSDNMMDKTVETRMRCAIAASNKIRRFTDMEMDEIKSFHKEFGSYKKTMERFNISSKGTLHNMLNVKYQTTKIKGPITQLEE